MDRAGNRNLGVTLFVLWTLQGIISVFWLGLLPGGGRPGALLGFSTWRLVLMGTALGLAVSCALAAWFSRRAYFKFGPAHHDALYLLALLTVILCPSAILILHALGQTSGLEYGRFAASAAPLAFWFSLDAIELLAWLIWTDRVEILATLMHRGYVTREARRIGSITFLVLGGLTVLVVATGLGSSPHDEGSWGYPTTPLLEWQILLALTISLVVPALAARWQWLQHPGPRGEAGAGDSWTALLVYLFTCVLWLSQPIRTGYFATAPRAPNFEIYPFSDALTYAQYAQSALAGYGFLWPDVPTRPLYNAFLTWLHALAGQDYTRIITLQTLVLAAFPAVLYLLGKELGGRPLGLGLAVLTALRDLTANAAAPFALNYTYSKLFFSELPAAFVMSVFTLMVMRWMRQPKPTWYPLLAGGILGLATLIRLQSAAILFAMLPFGFFVIQNRRKWMVGSGLMVLGVALALLPWVARNYLATGGLVLDNPVSQITVLTQRWGGYDSSPHFPFLPGESAAAYSGRMTGLALQSLRDDPARILGAAAHHFVNNEISNLLVFPLRDRLDSPAELIWPEHAFWQAWNSRPTPGEIPAIAFYLFLFGLGLAAAFSRLRLLGLLPLAASLAYNLWTALFLSSGARFLVPIDWAVYLYHFLGLLTLARLVLTGLRSARGTASASFDPFDGEAGHPQVYPVSWQKLALTGAAILCMGASIPLTELAFPKIRHLAAPTLVPAPGEILIYGRAIYPRWYKAGRGEPGTAKVGYGKSDEARLVFFLVGEHSTLVVFPTTVSPAFFPNASDVAILGTQEAYWVRAERIVLESDGKIFEYGP